MKTGAPGGKTTRLKTDREDAKGGEIEARAEKMAVDMELGRGNIGGGREGGPQPPMDHNK